jgi:hypothetical protein
MGSATERHAVLPSDFFALVGRFSGPWALAMLVVGILAWQSPKIIRELRRKRP